MKTKREKRKLLGTKREQAKLQPRDFETKCNEATRPRVRTHKRNETISRLSTPQQPMLNYGRSCSLTQEELQVAQEELHFSLTKSFWGHAREGPPR